MSYRIIPISADFLTRVRQGYDDQRQPAEFIKAKGGEPLRDVLRGAHAGEDIILASYCPFELAGPYKEYGAVFVRAVHSDESAILDRLPIAPSRNYFGDKFVLRAYSAKERIVDAALVSADDADSTIARFLDMPEVGFILARFAAHGCYGCRIERDNP